MTVKRSAWLVVGALVLGVLLSMALWSLPTNEGKTQGGESGEGGAPARVILFAPNLTETAWALGYGDRIVAVTDFCVWPPELMDLPTVGGALDPNLERILALHPSLLVVEGQSVELQNLAAQDGIAWARVEMDGELDSIFSGFARLDSLLGGNAKPGAQELSRRVRRRLKEVREKVPWSRPPRVLLSLGHDPGALARLWTVGSNSFLQELLEIAGGQGLASPGISGYYDLSLERLLADPPDVVLELRPGEKLDPDQRRSLARLWRDAGVAAPVEVITFDGLLIPGPRIAQTARALQEALLRAWPNRK